MNNLNSVLLEGVLTGKPKLSNVGHTLGLPPVCWFTLESKRTYKQGDETQDEVSYFDVRVLGRIGVVCQETLTKGRGVRVVGRLKQERCTDSGEKAKNLIYIIAEHVEFKPQRQIESPIGDGSEKTSEDTTSVKD